MHVSFAKNLDLCIFLLKYRDSDDTLLLFIHGVLFGLKSVHNCRVFAGVHGIVDTLLSTTSSENMFEADLTLVAYTARLGRCMIFIDILSQTCS